MAQGEPVNRAAAVVIVAIWLLLAFAVALVVYRFLRHWAKSLSKPAAATHARREFPQVRE